MVKNSLDWACFESLAKMHYNEICCCISYIDPLTTPLHPPTPRTIIQIIKIDWIEQKGFDQIDGITLLTIIAKNRRVRGNVPNESAQYAFSNSTEFISKSWYNILQNARRKTFVFWVIWWLLQTSHSRLICWRSECCKLQRNRLQKCVRFLAYFMVCNSIRCWVGF